MARWTDFITRQEDTANKRPGGMVEFRGVVIHTAEGYYEGTISWEKNRSAQVSSHFVTGKNSGQVAQMMDDHDGAWTQIAGNYHWLSVENEGFGSKGRALTDWQCEVNARILFEAHTRFGVPLQLANDPSGRGLGHHSMGGSAWGHLDCPGPVIIAQKQHILDLARAMAGVTPTPPPSNQLVVDGSLGPKTITRWQQVMGTPVDGKIDQPPLHSALVTAVQNWLNSHIHANLVVDGQGIAQDNRPYRTVAALQRYLGTPIDSVLSVPVSECVKALQRRLNTGKF